MQAEISIDEFCVLVMTLWILYIQITSEYGITIKNQVKPL